jgi:hypothetical protein
MLARTKEDSWKHGRSSRLAGLAIAAALQTFSISARAQDAQAVAVAETLFGDARKLMNDGNFVAACPKLEESERLAPAVGTLLNLGICYEKSERTASAWATFKEAISAARTNGQAERERLATSHAASLEGKIATLTIHVPADLRDVGGLTVKRDDVVVTRPAWDSAMPLDSGAHRIEVSAQNRRTWSTTVTLVDGAPPASVDVPLLETVPMASAPAKTSPILVGGASRSWTDEKTAYGAQRTLGVVVVGLGVASVAAGSVFGVIAKSKNDDAVANHCAGNFCDSQGLTLTSEARSSATAATVSFAAGGVALVTGGVLFFTAPKRTTRVAVHAAPTLTAHSAGFSFGGTW